MNELLKYIVAHPNLTEKEMVALLPNVDVPTELTKLRKGAYVIQKTDNNRQVFLPTALGVSKGQ